MCVYAYSASFKRRDGIALTGRPPRLRNARRDQLHCSSYYSAAGRDLVPDLVPVFLVVVFSLFQCPMCWIRANAC